jgi:hypothetical protein
MFIAKTEGPLVAATEFLAGVGKYDPVRIIAALSDAESSI